MMLTQARFEVLARLVEEVDTAADAAVALHNKLLQDGINALATKPALHNLTYGYFRENMWHEGTVTNIDSYGVTIEWDEYARSCRVDGGRHDIPSDALCDATRQAAIEQIVATKLEKIDQKANAVVARDRANKMAELARLKRELGQE